MNPTTTAPDLRDQRVALIDCSERHQASLEKSLQRLGIRWLVVRDNAMTPLDDCFAAIVELDTFNSPDVVEQLRARGMPICALTRQETLSQIQRGVALGATAMLHQPITQGTVYTALMMAFALSHQIGALNARNASLQKKLESYPLVAQAIARLIVELDLSEDEAYERLRSRAMATHRSLVEVSDEVLRQTAASRRASS
ncbi:ANTAR domain-containing response regulator [Paraburkholderia rhizosphaerae]|uniref:AmiR/NasT family two-component response regulator n=1 Tax=Paraburkholderia rhizosphaerae TaxID=480658 RepID=A0A4R8LQJ1_9BURK|nr:ANTAR domain-containing protein [Paraburkholderia rhizosphaerae]TDY49764.1 AmiR/NasT family two-component response regulator [Paraburkholderia rhizosphaerae]